jgi:hypothetical protein
MSMFHRLLQRWGFVQLDRYGLVRTADDRILTTRAKILDDGTGGRIVGWQHGDPAVVQLAAWEPPRRKAVKQLIPTISAPVPPASAAVMTAAVAGAPVVDEDDWEWTIALARARAVPTAAPVTTAPVARAVPATVIPVPPLPAVDLALHAGKLAPVVRPPSRLAKGTGPLAPASSAGRTTAPLFTLPPAARTVALPEPPRRRTGRR